MEFKAVPFKYRGKPAGTVEIGGQERIWLRLPDQFLTHHVEVSLLDIVQPNHAKAAARAITTAWSKAKHIKIAKRGWEKRYERKPDDGGGDAGDTEPVEGSDGDAGEAGVA